MIEHMAQRLVVVDPSSDIETFTDEQLQKDPPHATFDANTRTSGAVRSNSFCGSVKGDMGNSLCFAKMFLDRQQPFFGLMATELAWYRGPCVTAKTYEMHMIQHRQRVSCRASRIAAQRAT